MAEIAGDRAAIRPWREAQEGAAAAVILAIFPGFFVYHVLAAWGVMPLVIGNGWSVLNILGFAVLGSLAMLSIPHPGINWRWHAPFLSFLGLVIAYAVAHRLWGDDVQSDPVLFAEVLKFAASTGCIYLIGAYFPRSRWFTMAALISLGLTACVTIAATDHATLTLDPNTRGGIILYEAANYQAMARSMLPLMAISIALVQNPKHQALLLGPSLLALFLIGGRSEFLGGLALAGAWGMVQIVGKSYRSAIIAVLFTALLFGFALGGLWAAKNVLQPQQPHESAATVPAEGIEPPTPNSVAPRQMEIVDLEQSQSWQERSRYLAEGWADIVNSPIFGDYGGQMRSRGDFGDYVHNALSAWRQFGLVGFALYVLGCVGALVYSAKAVFVDRSDDPLMKLAFYWSLMSILMIVLVKAVFWTLPMLGWGLVAGHLATRRASSADI